MAKFYFVRHGEANMEEAYTKIYQDWGFNMLTLSDKGIKQIKKTAKDERLKEGEIIVSSPFSRALHTASILSKELGIDLKVETDLHEWIPDASYKFLDNNDAINSFREFIENKGIRNDKCKYNWESIDSIKSRVNKVLEKYKNYHTVIIVCHGVIMQCLFEGPQIKNGEIRELEF